MKQIITLLFLSLFVNGISNAQSVYFAVNDQTVENGATLTYTAALNDFDEMIAATNHYGAPEQLYIKTKDGNAKVTCTTEIISKTANGLMQWCGIDGACLRSNESISKGPAVIVNNKMELDGIFQENEYGTIKVKVSVRSGLESRVLYIDFVYSEDGGSGIHSANNNASVKVAGNNLQYKFDSSANRQLNIYNVTGTLLRSEQLAAAEGTVVLNNLSKGIYIYEVKENGKRTVTHKCVIQ